LIKNGDEEMNGVNNKVGIYLMQGLQFIFALTISVIQTGRIINTTKKYETISLLAKVIGLILAGGGTILIVKKIKDIAKMTKENNFLLRNK
jgi:hypothetical protein